MNVQPPGQKPLERPNTDGQTDENKIGTLCIFYSEDNDDEVTVIVKLSPWQEYIVVTKVSFYCLHVFIQNSCTHQHE